MLLEALVTIGIIYFCVGFSVIALKIIDRIK